MKLRDCPYCRCTRCEAEFVDIGVGYQQVSPYVCPECCAVEVGPYDKDPPSASIEAFTGWYAPPGIPHEKLKTMPVWNSFQRHLAIERVRAKREQIKRDQEAQVVAGYGQW
jgi:hypothetical protein